MNYLDNDIYEINKMDAHKKLQEAIENILGESKEKDFNKFMSLCKMSALQGNSHAQYILGIFYEDGIEGLEGYFETDISADEKWYDMISYEKALEWYEKSANQGYKSAQYMTGQMYFKGLGVERNYKKALYWFKNAKTEHACFYVGNIYEKGFGIFEPIKRFFIISFYT